MATGYDNQQPQRQSFAIQPAAPAQSRSTYQGASRGSQVVGGDSQGQGITVGPQTDPGAIGGGLGAYFEGAMQLYLERKQQEGIYKGFHAAQSGIALKELSHPDNPITKIFGPTGYEQGAQMYAAQTAVSTWQAAHVKDMDNLIQMKPDQLAKHLADTSTQAMTGDPFADRIIQRGLIEATGPLMNTVVKTKEAWQQNDAVTGQHVAVMSAGTALQGIVTSQIALGSKGFDAEGNSAIAQAMGSFGGLLAKPFGMDESSYHKSLVGIGRDAMQSGQGYAVAAMKTGGRWFGGKLTPDEEDKLDEQYLKFGARANGEAAEKFTDELIRLDVQSRHGELDPTETAHALSTINEDIKKATGFDYDVIDAKAVRAGALTVTEAVISADNKRLDRDWELYLRRQDRASAEAFQLRKEAGASAAAQITWRSGSPVQGIAGGVSKDLIEAQASNDWYKGDVKSIVRVFSQGYVSDAVKAAASTNVEASIGEQYNKDFAQAHHRWSTLNAAKPAAALSYYGKYHPMMQKFDAMTRQGSDPITAFSKTFGDPMQYSTQDIDPERRKAVDGAMDKVIASQRSWAPGLLGPANLGDLGNNVIKQAARSHVAVAGNNSPVSTEKLMEEAIGAATADGSLERYGQFAWRNKAGTEPLNQLLGFHTSTRDATAVFTSVYGKHMTALGLPTNTDPDSLLRIDNNGHPAMIAVVKDANGGSKRVVIPYAELATAAHDYVKGKLPGQSETSTRDPTMHAGSMK